MGFTTRTTFPRVFLVCVGSSMAGAADPKGLDPESAELVGRADEHSYVRDFNGYYWREDITIFLNEQVTGGKRPGSARTRKR